MNSYSKSSRVLFLLVCIFIISSCASKPDTIWFTSSPCNAPCWFGIIPGTTTSSELELLMNSNSYIDQDSISNRGAPMKEFTDVYSFDLQNNIRGEVSVLDDRVSSILLASTKDRVMNNSTGLTIGELINIFGTPDYVLRADSLGQGPFPFSDAIHKIVFLVYPKKGIVVGYNEFLLPRKLQNQVNQDIEVGYIKYFYPEDFGLLLEMGSFSMGHLSSKDELLRRLQPWKGFGEYPDID